MATFYPHQYRNFSRDRKTGSRSQLIFLAFLLVATCIALVAIIFLASASISGCDHKMMSRPYDCSFSDRFLSQLLKCSCDLNDWSQPRVEFFQLRTSCCNQTTVSCRDLIYDFINRSTSRPQVYVATCVVFIWRRDLRLVSQPQILP